MGQALPLEGQTPERLPDILRDDDPHPSKRQVVCVPTERPLALHSRALDAEQSPAHQGQRGEG